MTIELDGKNIDYTLKLSNRRTLGLEVKQGGALIITAPKGAALSAIEKVLFKKKNWILKKINQSETSQRFQPARRFTSGEIITILGEEYTLQVNLGLPASLRVSDEVIVVNVKEAQQAQMIVSRWIAKVFEAQIQELTQKCLNHFNQVLDLDFKPVFKIRKMYKRWGSCSVDGRIHLSHSLFTAKPEWIEYVIYHELSHLIHHDHSARYYSVLGKVCPEHKKLKSDLQKNTVIYLAA